MRRDPETIFAAHQLDPERCELFVEGTSDRRFLSWLIGDARSENAVISEMATVHMPGVPYGGERGRLLRFAELALQEPAKIRCFADADADRLLGRSVPENVWLTDLRDVESYLLREDCLEKILRLGLGNAEHDPAVVLSGILAAARKLALFRLLSEMDDLQLPFQATQIHRNISVNRDSVTLDDGALLQALMQNAEISLAEVAALDQRLQELEGEFSAIEDLELVRGKDALMMLAELVLAAGGTRDEASRLIWTSFERALAPEYPVLMEVLAYLRTCAVNGSG